MDPWRARLLASWELIMEDDDEDDFNLNLVLGSVGNNEGIPLPRVSVGSRQGRAPNIERHRHEMHERMMQDYFCDTSVYGPVSFRQRY